MTTRSVGGYREPPARKPLPRKDSGMVSTPRLMRMMEDSLSGWFHTEQVYDAVLAEYNEKYGIDGIDDPRARSAQRAVAYTDADSDLRLRKAVVDGKWYRERAQTAALALLVRRMVPIPHQSTKE